ncbi:MAG: FHA domain-containing protein, partial [Armatimonadota bacterium]
MSLNSKVVLSFFLGACSGLLAWILIDFNGFYQLPPQGGASTFQELIREEAFVGIIFGSLVGLAMGLVNGIGTGSASRLRRELLWGAAVGIMGGLLGLIIGQWFYGGLHHGIDNYSKYPVIGPVAFMGMVLVRGIGWGFIGLFIGLVQGIPSKSKKAAKHGAIGGLIGGLLGGMLFEIVPYIIPPIMTNPGIISRGISMTITGASIGLFIGLIQNILKQAWIRVVAGRNEGKEFIISKTRTTIGRDELADIPLFGDMNISQLHAVIDSDIPGKYLLRDAGSTSGMAVNNQRVPEQALRDGDIIQIGKMSLEFHEKAGMKIVRPVDTAAKSIPRLPMSDDVCQFCGGKKDPKTGACACSIGAQVQAGAGSLYTSPLDNQVYPVSSGTKLMGVTGPYAGQVFILPLIGDASIGRDSSKNIDLSMDNTVSRNHAHINVMSGAYTVYDDG